MKNAKFYAVIYGTNETEQIEVFNDIEAAELFAGNLKAAEISCWVFEIGPTDAGQRLHDMFAPENRQFIGGSIFERVVGPPDLTTTPRRVEVTPEHIDG